MKVISHILFLFTVFGVLSCSGGGSAGTGTISIEGTLRTSLGEPIAQAIMSVPNMPFSTVTNSSGEFMLEVREDAINDSSLSLGIQFNDMMQEIVVPNVTTNPNGATVKLDIELDPDTNVIHATNITVTAQIVGECDYYFENTRPIRQGNEAPQGILCTLKVWISGDGKPLSHTPFALEYTGCSEKLTWTRIATRETRSGKNAGVGQLEFPFFDDQHRCVYRVIAPSSGNVEPVITKIITFSKRMYDARS